MGFLKKIFKPVSKVLDKIIPNEIKPALPYLAAFAPMFGPTSALMGQGIMQRALLSGGMNIAGQLAQEGNEGDINLLSAGLGALSGAMTAPGFKSGLERFRPTSANEMLSYGESAANLKPSSFLDKATNVGIDYLGKGSDFMQAPGLTKYGIPAAQGTMDNMYAQAKRDQDAYDDMMSEDSEGGYTDDAYRAAIRKSMEAYGASEEEILRAIEAAGYKTGGRVGFKYGGGDIDLLEKMQEMVIAEPFKREEGYMEEEINIEDLPVIKEPAEYDEDREVPLKLLNMKTGGRVGFSSGDYVGSSDNETMEDEYDSYIKEIEIDGDSPMSFSKFKKMISEDYAKGGRVGLRFGGIGAAINQIDNQEMKEAAKFASMLNDMDVPIADLAEEFEIQFKRKPNSLEELKQFYKDRYDYKGPGDVKMKEEIKEKVVMEAKDGGRIGLQEGGILQQLIGQAEQLPAISQRPSLGSFQPLQQAGAVFPRLNQLEQGVDRAEETLGRIRSRLGPEQKTQLAGFQPMLQPALGYQPLNMLSLNRGMGISALQSGPETQGMKDGGMMDLGGREMDMRGGGFIPIGKKERADDVPARLSKNEFVMTADAVRAAGGGSVNKGAKRMYDLMNNLEARV